MPSRGEPSRESTSGPVTLQRAPDASSPERPSAGQRRSTPLGQSGRGISYGQVALEPHRINDVGVAGIHRLLGRTDALRSARVLVVVAGMEGALFSVLAGLVPGLVVAVPTSVGYGVSAKGNAALHSALASCAPGVVAVNIDNGFGAAVAALKIIRAR